MAEASHWQRKGPTVVPYLYPSGTAGVGGIKFKELLGDTVQLTQEIRGGMIGVW